MIEFILRWILAFLFYFWGANLLGMHILGPASGKQFVATLMIYWAGVLMSYRKVTE